MIMIETVMFFYYFPNSVNSILTLPAPPPPPPSLNINNTLGNFICLISHIRILLYVNFV